MVFPHVPDQVHPASAGAGERFQQRLKLPVGKWGAGSEPGGKGSQFSVHTAGALGVRYRVHQRQQIQQLSASVLRRGGQQILQPAVNFCKYRACGGKGFQGFRSPLKPKIFGQQAGSGYGGLFQPCFYIK